MASFVAITILLLCYLIVGTQTIGKTTVEVTSLPYPVVVGGILAISCEIRNMQEEFTVSLYREFDGITEQISLGELYYPSALSQRVFISRRALSDGKTIYFLTVVDVSQDDQGEYICSVSTMKNRQIMGIATHSITIELFSFPQNVYPKCQSIPNIMRVNEETKVKFICSSGITNPVVELQWRISNNEDSFTSIDNIYEDKLSSEITLIAKRSHSGATFVCTMTSSGFPERQKSCYVGPVTVVYDGNEKMIDKDSRLGDLQSTDHDSSLSKGCGVSCPSDDTNTFIYLAAGTMGAAILMFTFFTTTLILCCKYCKISGEVRAVQRSVPYDDGSEPVYVSLQRRPEPERSSMFMSVEDPNNPGNKVLMPRELVEEFYRSLSLKRKK